MKDYKKIHRDYISSREWLLKKNELISVYLQQGWEISCCLCDTTDNLQVHHTRYANFGKEVVTDERIWDLVFLCKECHKKTHQNGTYYDNRLMERVGF